MCLEDKRNTGDQPSAKSSLLSNFCKKHPGEESAIKVSAANENGRAVLEWLATLSILLILVVFSTPRLSALREHYIIEGSVSEIDHLIHKAQKIALSDQQTILLTSDLEAKALLLSKVPTAKVPYPGRELQTLESISLQENFSVVFEDEIRFDAKGFLVDETGVLQTVSLLLRKEGVPVANLIIHPSGAIEYV